MDYQKMYTTLFNAVSESVEELENGNSVHQSADKLESRKIERALALLKNSQIMTEEMYIEG
ncbi:MAG: hypothetical protein ACI4GA_01080 [Acutalibacteraceae bacterium]|nr:hypothetical protein [Oscillospiraceae bacterium]